MLSFGSEEQGRRVDDRAAVLGRGETRLFPKRSGKRTRRGKQEGGPLMLGFTCGQRRNTFAFVSTVKSLARASRGSIAAGGQFSLALEEGCDWRAGRRENGESVVFATARLGRVVGFSKKQRRDGGAVLLLL